MVKIFVGNLQAESTPETEAQLRHMFEQFGTVRECDILTGKNFGFVHMDDENEAQAAIDGLNGTYLFDTAINVERSSNPGRGKRPPGGGYGGGGGGGGGYSRGGGGYSRGGGGGDRGFSRGRGFDRGRGRGDRGGRGRGDQGGYSRGGYGGGGGGYSDRGGRGRGGDRGQRRYTPYGRGAGGRDPPPAADAYDSYEDPYESLLPALARDPLARLALARGSRLAGDPYADDITLALERRARLKQLYERDLLARHLAAEEDPAVAERPPPEYYGRAAAAAAADPYGAGSHQTSSAGAGGDRGLVSYPVPRSTTQQYGGQSARASNGGGHSLTPAASAGPQTTSLYTDFA